MPDAARLNDNHSCPKTTPNAHVGGPVNEGSPNVEVNGRPLARVTDRTRCTGVNQNDLILKGSATVEANGLPATRKTDETTHGGLIADGSPNVEIGGASVRATSAQLAAAILKNPRIHLAQSHVSGVNDTATARQNIVDTAAGNEAACSDYGNAPGGTTPLDQDMLTEMQDLSKDYDFSVSEIAGGSHSANSAHYDGTAFDINRIGGTAVNSTNPNVSGVENACTSGGASLVLGPGDPGHGNHIHTQW